MCCNVVQCVAVHVRALTVIITIDIVAMCCNVLQCVALCCIVREGTYVAVCCSVREGTHSHHNN